MSMWSLRWHFTNKSVAGALTVLKVTVTVCHTNAAENKAVVDIRLRSAVWCCPLVSQFQFALPLSTRAIAGNMTSSANPEIHNLLQRLQRRIEPRAQKVWWSLYVWFRRYSRTDPQRDWTQYSAVYNTHTRLIFKMCSRVAFRRFK